ncbi:uncharacterized protein LOC128551677 isoform X1 [Mercenaria mercenaria]|uniref:uncharacterized protein LOC128551677 isoform X1 n=1 Tax=Mercenaria mercenaria TaxID=6596 RepID=UPI00234F056B|nr:uncharacterized protein LOC128551677 isoform X1 [Mercenaria mercenaria]
MGVLKEIVYRLFIFVVIIRHLAASEYTCVSADQDQLQCSYGCCEEDGTVTCCKLLPVDVRTIVIGIGFLCTAVLLIAVMAKYNTVGPETRGNDKDSAETEKKDGDSQTTGNNDGIFKGSPDIEEQNPRCCFCKIIAGDINCKCILAFCPREST